MICPYWSIQYIHSHYSDVIMGELASQITSSRLFIQPFIQAQIKENIKGLRHRPLCKGPVTRKMFPFDDVIMSGFCEHQYSEVTTEISFGEFFRQWLLLAILLFDDFWCAVWRTFRHNDTISLDVNTTWERFVQFHKLIYDFSEDFRCLNRINLYPSIYKWSHVQWSVHSKVL